MEEVDYWFLEEGNKGHVEDILDKCDDDVMEVIMNLREDLLCALEEIAKLSEDLC